MRYVAFNIRNFKGIQELSFKLDQGPLSNIFTFVGLNESGKTTILEALSLFYEEKKSKEESEEPLLHAMSVDDVHSLIPKGRRLNFSDDISIKAVLGLDEDEVNELCTLLKKHGWKPDTFEPEVEIELRYTFKDSRYKTVRTFVNCDLEGRKKGQRKPRSLDGSVPEAWGAFTDWLLERLPPIIYYPNFLFDFPDRIYLEPVSNESKEGVFYRKFLQDILDSMKDNLDLEDHILVRAKSDEPADKEALESVLNKMSSQVSRLVFNKELSVFKTDNQGKRSVQITSPQFAPEPKAYYLTVKLREGDDSYFIRERSLGFRWFFTFLLLTQFRVARAQGEVPVFLFDEPASNLHQTAQQRLLKALEELTKKSGVSVVYTTHSHHLIDPKWLENTFIVRNKALDYTHEDEYTSYMTEITIERYRSFVGQHPDQRTYFQPILDVLEYKPSNLENIPNVVMTEGKNDYYTLMYALGALGSKEEKCFPVLPGGGAGSLDAPIQLYMAWGRSFIVLLDADGEGQKQKKRYVDLFGEFMQERVFTLEDINPVWKNLKMEDLFEKDDRLSIQKATSPKSARFRKKLFNIAIREALVTSKFIALSKSSRKNLEILIEGLGKKLSESGS